MNKKSLLGLLLFACIVITGLFAGVNYLINSESQKNADTELYTTDKNIENDQAGIDTLENNSDTKADASDAGKIAVVTPTRAVDLSQNITAEEPITSNPSDMGSSIVSDEPVPTGEPGATAVDAEGSGNIVVASVNTAEAPKLITDCDEIDYKAYIPEMIQDSELKAALDIKNPDISVDAEAAVLFDANTKKVLYYKNPVQAMFPASTAKLLTSLVALKMCKETEEVTLGDEVKMIASDSTRAGVHPGEVLTIRNLLEGMLLPSGNDAAYAVAAYVGKKSLGNMEVSKEAAVSEFIRLMNEEAASLGVKNSCFKTPDGYDAIGQYTTAYDMGLIGVAASNNSTIIDVTQKSSARNIFVSGEDVTWDSTNKLIKRYSGQYFSKAIGLKTGTSTMAGRCLVAAAEEDGKKVVCVIMDSTMEGRWEDAITLLKYGLQ